MDVNPGEFDRLVKFESIASKGNTFGSGGGEVWEETLRVWARVRQATASDRFRSEAGYRTSIVAVFTIPWTSSVNNRQRIDYDGKKWSITGLAELGYKELLEVTAEVIDG